jgi:hypothetical protein
MSASGRHLVVVVPGLCGPESDPPVSDYLRDRRPVALDYLLSRSRVQTDSCHGLDATLARLFGLAHDASHDIPVAALTWLADTGQPPDTWLMRADPVHLRADQSCLRLFDSHSFAISRQEADALVAVFNSHFGDSGWTLAAPHPQRWYLMLPQSPSLQTLSPARVAGQDIDPCLPRGTEAAGWHALLNEIQMLFHTHPVNLERERRGEPAINSIWPWGGGQLPEQIKPRVTRVFADELLAAGLGQHAALPRTGLPVEANALLPELADGDTLLVDDRLEWPMHYSDIDAWLDGLQGLEVDWFVPLLAALRDGTLASLEIHPCTGRVFQVTRRGLWRFWKGVRAFETMCDAR